MLLQVGSASPRTTPRLIGSVTFSIIACAENEGWREKSDYILQNPVRAGLIGKCEDWPYVLLPADG